MFFRALIWRPLRNDWGRTLLSLLAIALGVAVVIALRVANRGAIASFQRTTSALAGDADLLVSGPQPLPAALLPRLFPLNSQAEFFPYLDRRAYDPRARDTLHLLGLDLLASTIAPAGKTPLPATGHPAILLAAAYAAAHGLKLGDPLTLSIGGEPHTFQIAALLPASPLAPPDLALLDLPDALAAFEPNAPPTRGGRGPRRPAAKRSADLGPWGPQVGASMPPRAVPAGRLTSGTRAGGALGPAPITFDGLRVRLAPGANPQALSVALRPLVPAADTIAPPRARLQQDTQMLAAFRANLQALAYVSLLVGIFLIYNTVSISVVRRRTAIATLRALGATRAALLRLFLLEGAVLSLLGGALGLLFGWLLAASAMALVQRTINNLYAASAPAPATLVPADALWALGLALGAGLFAALGPARAASRTAPAQALRPGTAESEVRTRALSSALVAAALALAAVLCAYLPEPGAAAGGISVPWFGFASALLAVLAAAALAPPLLALLLPRLRRALWRQRGDALRANRRPLPASRRHSGAGLPGIEARTPSDHRERPTQKVASHLRRALGLLGMAAGSLAGALRRSAVLIAALATAIAVTFGVAIMVGSFRQTVTTWIGQQLQGDVFVRAADWDRTRPAPLAPALLAAVAATPGLAQLEASHSQAWSFRGQPTFLNTRWSLTPQAPRPEYQFLQGGPGPVLVSEPFARRFRLWPGDAFTLAGPKQTLRLTVAGVFYDYTSDRGLLVLDRPTFARAFGPPTITELGLVAAPGVTPSALRRRLERRLPHASSLAINDNASLRRQALAVFDQTFRITYALEFITLIVAILGVGNTLLAVVLERAPEFALLRFLGATRHQLGGLLLAESGLAATLALALGAPLGAVLSLILVRVINVQSFGWTIQLHPPYAFLAAAAALVWLATLLAGWLPAQAAQRQSSPSTLEAE